MYGTPASAIPPIPLDLASDTPLYRQIFGWFRGAICAGTLRAGQRVPSTRELARVLGISRIPVLGAYELLFAEGYLKPLVGVGTCVAMPNAGTASRPEGQRDLAIPAPVKAAATAKRKISQRAALLRGPAQAWLEESSGSRSGAGLPEEFPVGIWSRLVARHARRAAVAYGDPMGLESFRNALAPYLAAFRGVTCEESQILVTAGSQHALQICALALLDPGDRVWIEEPGFPGAQQAFRSAGVQLVPVPVDAEGLDVECGRRRESRVRAAFVTPSAHFPLGVPMSPARRLALLGWAEHKGAWIIEDDYDSEFRPDAAPEVSLQDGDVDDRVIHVGTLSAVMFPALRLGYIIVPKDLAAVFASVRPRRLPAPVAPAGHDRLHSGGALLAVHRQNAHGVPGSPAGIRRGDSERAAGDVGADRRSSRHAPVRPSPLGGARHGGRARGCDCRAAGQGSVPMLHPPPGAGRAHPELREARAGKSARCGPGARLGHSPVFESGPGAPGIT